MEIERGDELVVGYQEPVLQLLALGEIDNLEQPYDYLALGLTLDDAPELIRVLRDDVLYSSDSEDESWASLHAALALGQLRAESAVDALVANLSRIDDDDDWVMSAYPGIFGQIGPAALPALQEALRDSTKSVYQRVFASEAVLQIAEQHPDARDRCVALLVDQLRLHAEQSEWLNASLINNLVELDAQEAAPVMAEAFAANRVDWSLMGDWEEVQIALGLLAERLTPEPNTWFNWEPGVNEDDEESEEYERPEESEAARQQRLAEEATERLRLAKVQQAKEKKRKQDKQGRKQARQNKIKKKKK